MNHSTRLQLDVAPLMTITEAELGASQDQPFEMVRNDAQHGLPILAWKVVLNDKSELGLVEAAAAGNEEAPGEHESSKI